MKKLIKRGVYSALRKLIRPKTKKLIFWYRIGKGNFKIKKQ